VWAVGSASDPQDPFSGRTLTEHWDGTAWRVVRSPVTGKEDADRLNAVAARASGDVWTAGNFDQGPFQILSLTEHWDGTSWQIVSAPPTSSLSGLAAFAANDVWAVGSAIEHWDGSTWSLVVPRSR
jgi:hypothetical protein